MTERTKFLIAAAVIGNVAALAVLFWLVLDVRASTLHTATCVAALTRVGYYFEPPVAAIGSEGSIQSKGSIQPACDIYLFPQGTRTPPSSPLYQPPVRR